ncbi:hypothetical protein SRHO_G00240940 [Serrasalmus rhombeus]
MSRARLGRWTLVASPLVAFELNSLQLLTVSRFAEESVSVLKAPAARAPPSCSFFFRRSHSRHFSASSELTWELRVRRVGPSTPPVTSDEPLYVKLRLITMETAVAAQQQEGSVTETETSQIQSDSESVTQVSESIGESASVEVVTLPGGQTLQVQGVIQATQPSVIQSPQIQTIQVAATADGEKTDVSDTQKRRELLSRRPSYRKILSELSSDTPAVPKIEEEEKAEEDTPASSSVSTVTLPSSIYQTSSGQYIAITQGGAIQIGGPGGEGLQGVQALTLPSPAAPQPGATILQYAPQAGDPAQQLLLSAGQVLVQEYRLGEQHEQCYFSDS